MKYYIIAGEASGDLHGSNLIKQLKLKDNAFEARCWGGEKMESEGAVLVKHYKDLAFMGFIEVVMNLTTILKNIKLCKTDIDQYQPNVLILIDYPGFNMRIAEWAKNKGMKVIYYISPQVWAWKKGRTHKLKRDVDRMLCILPFEPDFYKKYQFNVDFVGHPLLDAIQQLDTQKLQLPETLQTNKKLIVLMPGSRKQEITEMLRVMVDVSKAYPQFQFVIAGAPSQDESFYRNLIGNENIEIVFGKSYTLLKHAYAAIVTSGTATLETALFEVPQVVCYKGNPLSFAIAKQLVKVPFISLVNLIAGKELVKELIQGEMNLKNVKAAFDKLLVDENRAKMIKEYREMKEVLGGGGASAKAADIILEELNK